MTHIFYFFLNYHTHTKKKRKRKKPCRPHTWGPSMLGGLKPYAWPKWPRPSQGRPAAMHDPKLISCQKVSVATRFTISFLIFNGLRMFFNWLATKTYEAEVTNKLPLETKTHVSNIYCNLLCCHECPLNYLLFFYKVYFFSIPDPRQKVMT